MNFVRDLPPITYKFGATTHKVRQALYNHPLVGYVVFSTAQGPFCPQETLAFASDDRGLIRSYEPLAGGKGMTVEETISALTIDRGLVPRGA